MNVIFLAVPESLRDQLNPDIPVPVEVPEGGALNLEELSWEMIIAGMLQVIAAGPEALVSAEKCDRGSGVFWIDYYRHFVLEIKPSIMSEFTEAAILKARNGDFDLSLEILASLRGLFPSSPVVALNRALVLEERAAMLERRDQAEAQEAAETAEAAYKEALSLQPPFPDALFNAGFFYLGRKDFVRARECFSQHCVIADNAEKKERSQSIIADIDENGLADESFSEAYHLILQGDEEAGLNRIRQFIVDYPMVWNGWFILGWALRRLNRWEEGAAAFGKAIELGGSNSDTRNELAICLMETGDLNGARRELETALRDDCENVKIISNLGVLALKSGNAAEAEAFFRTVLELDPEDPLAGKFNPARQAPGLPRNG